MCRVLTIARGPAFGNRQTGPVGFMIVVVLLTAILAAGPVLLILTFVATRALVRGERRRRRAAAGLAAVLLTLAAYLATGTGGANAYSDTACTLHLPPGFGEGTSITQGAGIWPPGLRCRFESTAGVATYQAGFDVVWVAAAMTAVVGAAMGVAVTGWDYARRRFG